MAPCLQLLIVRHFVEGALLFKLKLLKQSLLSSDSLMHVKIKLFASKGLRGMKVIACLLHEKCICSKAEGHGRLDLYQVRYLHTRYV